MRFSLLVLVVAWASIHATAQNAAWFGTPVPPPLSDHSSGDVYEAVPAEGIERAARFHAFFIERADQAPEQLITAGKGTPYQRKAQTCP
jgi:hypothetical protein